MRSIPFRLVLGTTAIAALLATGVVVTSSSSAPPPTPAGPGYYVLASDSQTIGIFKTLVGLDEAMTVPEPTANGKRTPGRPISPTVTLARGQTAGLEIDQWHDLTRAGSPGAPRTVDLRFYDADGDATARYILTNAVVTKLKVHEGESFVEETATLTADDIKRVE